ncbi:hypothetical protein FRC11_005634 [Ceratobasidium sp. 423]|nr:hypothetical protein FRC11_005634 [Ceratobasidium sp. 423]
MGNRPHSLFLTAAALTALGLTRAEMEFEGHWRRSTPSGPSTFVIPLAMDNNGIYHSAVSMGSNSQKFNFSLSGSTGYTVVAGQVCNACGDQNPLYSSTNSSSFQLMHELIDVTVDGVNQVFGNIAKENCALKQTNGSWWQYKNQTILVAGSVNDGTRDIFNPEVSGIIGLAPTAKLHSYADTVLGAWLFRNPLAEKVSVGFALKRPEILNATTNGNSSTLTNATTPDAGEMHMLAPDASSYYGELVTVPTVNYASSGGSTSGNGGGQQMQAAGWVTNLEEWTFLNPNGDRVIGGKGAHAAVDPWYNSIIMPRSESENIYQRSDDLDLTVPVPTSVYNAAQPNGSQQNSIGFGRRFPFQPPSQAQSEHARTIGIVVGSIAGVIILLGGGALAWLWRRGQQKAHHRAPSEEFMGASSKRFEYRGFRMVSSGLLGKAGAAAIAPGVIFNARRGSDPEAHPLMQTPPTTSSPPRDGVPPKTFAQQQGPITVHIEDTDREQGLHLPAHQVYLDRISKSAEGRGLRWPGSEQGYARISDQDMDAHAFGDHARVYSDDSGYDPQVQQRYDPPSAVSSNWSQPYHPPSPSTGNRLSMVVEPITKPAGVALKEEPNQNKD